MTVTAFTNAALVCPVGGEQRATLLVQDGTILGTGDAPADATVIDCAGKTLAPA